LHYLLRSERYITGYLSLSKGIRINQWDLDPTYHSRMPVLVPSVQEQRGIVDLLDRETAQIDDLIDKQERLIELLAEKRQAIITHAVSKGFDPTAPTKPSGIPWLGDIPAHWTVTTVKRLASVISKGTTPTTVGAEFTDEGIRFLKAENIQNNAVMDMPANYISAETNRLLARSELRRDDLLVVIAGATTGKSAVLSVDLTPCNTNQAVAFVRPSDPSMSQWIHHVLTTPSVQNLISSLSVQSAQPNLSMANLGSIWLPLPPTPEIDSILSRTSRAKGRLDELTTSAQRTVGLLRERRSALISAAVTGKIDVRREAS
jgi:type I restriction enzyme S subunit